MIGSVSKVKCKFVTFKIACFFHKVHNFVWRCFKRNSSVLEGESKKEGESKSKAVEITCANVDAGVCML